MKPERLILLSILGLIYITAIIFIMMGGIFISKTIFNTPAYLLEYVGLDNEMKIGLSKFIIILFWLVYIPLLFGPIIYFIAPKLYYILMDY